MPYCPKCDMEFVDGITNCSDCGGPLIDSREAAKLLEEEKLKREEETDFIEETPDEIDLLSGQRSQKNGDLKSDSHAYITKRQHYEDTRSSQSAFLLIGGIFFIVGILCFSGIIKLPLDPGPMILFQTVLTALGLAGLVVAAISQKSTARLIREADAEDARTEELVNWFSALYTAASLDELLLKEDPSLEENDLYLKRFELIQDRLITEQDLPNQSYVDYLCEEIYKRTFEES